MKNKDQLKEFIIRLKEIQKLFYKKFRVNDIYSNSKVFEILIANELNHGLVPGHSGSRDGKDDKGEYEYKHYKESSSNHTWTFNDFTDTTISNLNSCVAVIFAHIDDSDSKANFDWYYAVPGKKISSYLKQATIKIKNTRKMINVSQSQIKKAMGIKKSFTKDIKSKNYYRKYLDEIFGITKKIEKKVKTKEILTSNKFWEILVSLHTGHQILSEQKKHDAKDSLGNFYEYKVAKSYSWNFQDISPAVLKKYKDDREMILAVVDKSQMEVLKIFSAESNEVVKRLKEKLKDKKERYKKQGKRLRRLQVSLSRGDLKLIGANEIYSLN